MGKLSASFAFLAYAWAHGLWSAGPHGPWFVIALLLSAVGDAALLGKSKPAFLSGLGAFLLAHVAYAIGFLWLGIHWLPLLIGGVIVVPLGISVLEPLLVNAGSLAKPARIYGYVIFTMVVLSIAHGFSGLPGARPLLPVAAVIFTASDVFVGRQRLVAEALINRAVGLPLYFGAQLLFVLGAS